MFMGAAGQKRRSVQVDEGDQVMCRTRIARKRKNMVSTKTNDMYIYLVHLRRVLDTFPAQVCVVSLLPAAAQCFICDTLSKFSLSGVSLV